MDNVTYKVDPSMVDEGMEFNGGSSSINEVDFGRAVESVSSELGSLFS